MAFWRFQSADCFNRAGFDEEPLSEFIPDNVLDPCCVPGRSRDR